MARTGLRVEQIKWSNSLIDVQVVNYRTSRINQSVMPQKSSRYFTLSTTMIAAVSQALAEPSESHRAAKIASADQVKDHSPVDGASSESSTAKNDDGGSHASSAKTAASDSSGSAAKDETASLAPKGRTIDIP